MCIFCHIKQTFPSKKFQMLHKKVKIGIRGPILEPFWALLNFRKVARASCYFWIVRSGFHTPFSTVNQNNLDYQGKFGPREKKIKSLTSLQLTAKFLLSYCVFLSFLCFNFYINVMLRELSNHLNWLFPTADTFSCQTKKNNYFKNICQICHQAIIIKNKGYNYMFKMLSISRKNYCDKWVNLFQFCNQKNIVKKKVMEHQYKHTLSGSDFQ